MEFKAVSRLLYWVEVEVRHRDLFASSSNAASIKIAPIIKKLSKSLSDKQTGQFLRPAKAHSSVSHMGQHKSIKLPDGAMLQFRHICGADLTVLSNIPESPPFLTVRYQSAMPAEIWKIWSDKPDGDS